MAMFLTTQEMQELLHVDRSTVYRMAEDGRLPGVKIGRQWRFPAEQVAERLGLDVAVDRSPPPAAAAPADDAAVLRLGALLDADVRQSIADLLGEVTGVMAVITEMDGTQLTTVANQCGYYRAIADRPATAAACAAGWRELIDLPHVSPRFVVGHLGFLCARTLVWVDHHPVGMIAVGGVTPRDWPPEDGVLHGIAAELGVPVGQLAAHAHETWDVAPDRQREVLQLLPQFGDLVSQLAASHAQLRERLDAIAALADPSTPRPALPRREAP